MISKALRVPCCYQGGKQRVAAEIVDEMLSAHPSAVAGGSLFLDLCCGSGAIALELLNRGVGPENIVMLDAGSWGAFWAAIGDGSFDMVYFKALLAEIPEEKSLVKGFMESLAERGAGAHEAEIYPVLQAASFGGKQIWRDGDRWGNAFFRDYWLPKPGSVRRSPANPMQPAPATLLRRVAAIAEAAYGVRCVHGDVSSVFQMGIPQDAIAYIDPPYRASTGYAYGFQLNRFIEKFTRAFDVPLYVSEGEPLNDGAKRLDFKGAKGGISGTKPGKHEEWLTLFNGS